MERKIGEIFEFGGEWYQCVEHKGCHSCAFTLSHGRKCGFNGYPHCAYRSDGKSAIFKKLEKVGEPHFIKDEIFEGGKVYVQNFKVYEDFEGHKPICNDYIIYDWKNRIISIEIKQTKEDMEEKKIDCGKLFSELPHFNVDRKVINKDGYAPCLYQDDDKTWIIDWCDDDGERIITVKGISLEDVIIEAHNFCVINNYIKGNTITKLENISYKESVRYIEEMVEQDKLKPFDLEAAKAGKPVCTRDGRKARIICFDAKCNLPIIALVTNTGGNESLLRYYSNGSFTNLGETGCDLMMLSEKKEGWVNIYALNTCYSSKEEAEANIDQDYEDEYVRTVKIEWEE